MKQKLFWLLIAATAAASAQPMRRTAKADVFISTGIELQSAITPNTTSELNVLLKLGARDNLMEAGLFYENYHAENYQNYGLFQNLYFQPVRNLYALGGIELGIVQQTRSNKGTFTYAFNGEIRYEWKHLGIGLQNNFERRPDLTNKDWQYNLFTNIYFKF